MFHKLKVSQRTGARPSQDINVARVLGQVFPPTSHGFGKGRLSLQNLDLAHAWRQRPWLVLSLHGSQPQGTGARTWGQTQPRYVVSGPWALQPSRGEQHRQVPLWHGHVPTSGGQITAASRALPPQNIILSG